MFDLLTTNPNERRANASKANSQANAAYNAGNYAEALRLYRKAAKLNPNNGIIRDNLANAEAQFAQQARQQELNRRAAERDRQNARQAAAQASARAAEVARQQLAIRQATERNRKDASLLADSSGRIAKIAENIGRTLGADGSASSASGLAFDTPPPVASAAAAGGAPAASHTDTALVDAGDRGRPLPGLPRLELMDASPGREAWLRGMDAVARAIDGHPEDWQLAAAWFGTALQRDPANPALARAAILARWTMTHRERARVAAPPGPGASALQTPMDSDLRFLFDPAATPARERHATASDVPQSSDVDFLFDPNGTAAKLVMEDAVLDHVVNSDLVPVGEAARMRDARVGVVDAMIRVAGPRPDAESLRRIGEASREAARGLDGDSIKLLGRQDYAGIAALQNEAYRLDSQTPRYRIVRDAIRPMIAGTAPADRQVTPQAPPESLIKPQAQTPTNN